MNITLKFLPVAAGILLLTVTSCGSSETTTPAATSEANKTVSTAASDGAQATSNDPVKDAYYEFTAPADWMKPVATGDSKIYSVKVAECTCSFIIEMVNPKRQEWVAGLGDLTNEELLAKEEEKLKHNQWNTIVSKSVVQINAQDIAVVEYTMAEHDGHPNEHKRLYYFRKDKAIVSILVSATERCWEKFLPVAEPALSGMKML